MVRGGWVEFRHLVAPPNFGQDTPGRICGQAIAQKHQDPPFLGKLQALALLPHEADSQRQYLPVMTLNASIIAPGREGSQLGHAVVQTSTLPQ